MNNILIIWTKSKETVHINYHYTQFGEIIDYLDRKVDNEIKVIDEDIQIEDVIHLDGDFEKSIKSFLDS